MGIDEPIPGTIPKSKSRTPHALTNPLNPPTTRRYPSPMPQLAEPAPSFAGLLASLTAPKKHLPLDDLEPDIANLTYDCALRNHARYRPNPNPEKTSSPEPVKNAPAVAAASEPGRASASGACKLSAPTRLEQTRKRASITIRLTRSECAQLQQRAAEAGLTLSAYLRSCTVEADSLRAQVKQALADLRATPAANRRLRRSFFHRLLFFSHHPARAAS